ncbi:MAG TPA: FAD-dependent oxidoreductase [Candidatus Acidoferrales bacterium]|nr:FAD-dependent oxidoreductase [Candidatus Acidoferrales bacterium]
MKEIAVIGSGISGLAVAYYLSRRHRITLYEREPRLGGHTNTVTVDSPRGPVPIDTGFIVHNTRNYPNLVRLLGELNVPTVESDMSFSVRDEHTGFEYSSRGLRGFFAQRERLLQTRQYALLAEIHRFHRAARRLLARERPEAPDESRLDDFLERERFDRAFIRGYLYPLASAVWSTATGQMGAFPAATLFRFFENHGMLRLTRHIRWRTIPGGASRYIEPITAPYRERIVREAQITGIERRERGVRLNSAEGVPADFDEAVLACHGNQALALLANPTDAERCVLGAFRTTANEAVLHTDARLLPRTPWGRASWNCHLDGNGSPGATLTYHMNRLQPLPAAQDFCVTLNHAGAVDSAKILRRFVYHHPLYTLEAVRSQRRWAEISGRDRLHFCGAYWLYGFHEDGLNSAMRVARALGVEC